MNDAGKAYVLLQGGARPSEGEIVTRPSGVTVPAGEVRFAVDHFGRKHLLIPVHGRSAEDTSSRGVSLTHQVYGEGESFADLTCLDDSLALVFESLVNDVLAQISGAATPVRECLTVLGLWREMLRSAGSATRREVVVGLTAELTILRLLSETAGPSAFAAWSGPSGAVHDFVATDKALEVKATASVDGASIRVSNVDQLDPSLVGQLHLVVVHLRADPTAPDLDELALDLVNEGFDRSRLIHSLADAGHVFEGSVGLPRYEVRGIRVWHVDDEFPGLVGADIPLERRKGVTRVSYELNLDAAPAPLDDAAGRKVLRGWFSNA